MMIRRQPNRFRLVVALISLLLLPELGVAATLYLSHGGTGNQTLGGVTMDNGDVLRFDSDTGIATTVFNDDTFFDSSENVDAIDLLSNGNLVISTVSNASTGNGLHSFNHGDLIEVDISGATPTFVSIFLASADLYTGQTENINGFASGLGSSLLSTVNSGPATANSLSFDDGDITRFDASNPSGTASLYFDDDANFASSANIDAVSVLSLDSIAISTLTSESLSGESIGRGDVVALTHNGSGWVLTETLFNGTDSFGSGSNVNLDAVHVVIPEPHTGLLLCIGLLGLASRRKAT